MTASRRDADLPAVPLLVQRPGQQLLGASGFFAQVEGRTYLVTAAHVPLGGQPHDRWAQWPAEILVCDGAHRTAVELFEETAFGRRPRFLFPRSSTEPHSLADVLALEVSPGDLGLESVKIYPTRGPEPDLDEQVTAYGYPVAGPRWPVLHSLSGPVLRDDMAFVVARIGATEGFSGGPTLDRNGRLIGITIGTGRSGQSDDDDRIVVAGVVDVLPQLRDGHLDGRKAPFFPTE